MQNKKNFIFDLDGTLADTAGDIRKYLSMALADNGFIVDKEKIKIGPPLEITLEHLLGKAGRQMSDKIVEDYRKNYTTAELSLTKPYPGMVELLKKMAQGNLNVFVATFKPTASALIILNKYFDGLYKAVVSPSEIKNFNPCADKADLLNFLIENHKLDVSQCVMIGDAKTDITGARDVGMLSIAVLYGYAGADELAGADLSAENVDELEKIIFRLCK
ncbi:MAG: HAD hydrolase-like protein [Elusimicrobiota bacterium]|nr:HAD hydrolase-like protein [Elusimicrobiota bacterium]